MSDITVKRIFRKRHDIAFPIVNGIILILLGIKTLLEHLGVL